LWQLDEPEVPQADFHVRELEQKNCTIRREFLEIQLPVHRPHEEV
jgi:hypothetical protein